MVLSSCLAKNPSSASVADFAAPVAMQRAKSGRYRMSCSTKNRNFSSGSIPRPSSLRKGCACRPAQIRSLWSRSSPDSEGSPAAAPGREASLLMVAASPLPRPQLGRLYAAPALVNCYPRGHQAGLACANAAPPGTSSDVSAQEDMIGLEIRYFVYPPPVKIHHLQATYPSSVIRTWAVS